MKTAEAIERLKSSFSNAILSEVSFLDEVNLEICSDRLKEVLAFLKQTPEPGFEVLVDLTGVDYLQPVKRTKVVYLLQQPLTLARLRLVIFAERGQRIPSIVDLWPGANWYERELFDLFGVEFDGHPDLKRILMPDDWAGYPLRRDYALTEEPVQFKHGLKPKVPSQIIHHDKTTQKS